MKIRELTSFDEHLVEQIDTLMHELAPNACATSERVRKCVESESSHVYIAIDNANVNPNGLGTFEPLETLNSHVVVGCATLCVCTTPEMVLGFVEAVVVSSAHRGKHIGRQLMERIIADARTFGIQHLHLTSNPKRIAANGLYQALGFERKETNCYVMKVE